MRSVLKIQSQSPEQTLDVGRELGSTFVGGEIIELCGALGAGKTQLAKGLALGLGVSTDEIVVSPTFVLVREYAGRLTFYHCDAYRLQSAEELLALGLDEALERRDCVVAVEWADRFPDALDGLRFRVEIAHQGEQTRLIRITAPDAAHAAQLAGRLGSNV